MNAYAYHKMTAVKIGVC